MPDDSSNPNPTENPESVTQTNEQETIEKILKGEEFSKAYILESSEHGEIEIELTPVEDDETLFGYLEDFPTPDGGDVDDPEQVNPTPSTIPGPKAVKAIKGLVKESARSASIPDSELALIIDKRTEFETVAQLSGEVVDMSMSHNKDIDGFRPK